MKNTITPITNAEKQKNKDKRASMLATLGALAGKDIRKMKAAEQTDLLTVICQLLEIADDKGIVR